MPSVLKIKKSSHTLIHFESFSIQRYRSVKWTPSVQVSVFFELCPLYKDSFNSFYFNLHQFVCLICLIELSASYHVRLPPYFFETFFFVIISGLHQRRISNETKWIFSGEQTNKQKKNNFLIFTFFS